MKTKIFILIFFCLTIILITSYTERQWPLKQVSNLPPHFVTEIQEEEPEGIAAKKSKFVSSFKMDARKSKIKEKRVQLSDVTDPHAVRLSQQETPPFDPDFKNPCWWVESNSKLLCLPYFYLGGFPKSGTTDLYSRLLGHPFIVRPRIKEPHYLTRGYFKMTHPKCSVDDVKNVHTSCDIRNYAKYFFTRAASEIRAGLTGKIDGTSFLSGEGSKKQFKYPLITVDASASTVWDNSNGYHIIPDIPLSTSNSSIFDWIVKMNPNVRFLLIFREPVSRLYSDYNFFNGQTSPFDFHDRSAELIKIFSSCVKSGSTELDCARPNSKRVRLGIGLYSLYIEELMLRIPKERIHVMRNEDYHNNMSQSLQEIFQFLDLPQLNETAMSKILNYQMKNVNKKKVEPMLPQTRQMLYKFYRPFNKRLAKISKTNAFLWRDVYDLFQ